MEKVTQLPVEGSDRKPLDCDNNSWLHAKCRAGHFRVYTIRCGRCDNCVRQRKRVIYAKFYYKLEGFLLKFGRYPKWTMWSLGTSLIDSDKNRKQIAVYWKLFRKRMMLYSKRHSFPYKPLMYVVEAGSKGRRLHYHIIMDGFTPFNRVLRNWRDITGEQSNVNYSVNETGTENIHAINYILKYVMKQSGSYYWVGEFYKLFFPKKAETICFEENCSVSGHGIMYQFSPELESESEIEWELSKGNIKYLNEYYGVWHEHTKDLFPTIYPPRRYTNMDVPHAKINCKCYRCVYL